MERYIEQIGDEYFFLNRDWPAHTRCPYEKNFVGVLDGPNTGYHACVRSVLWENAGGEEDCLQKEPNLPEGDYIVCYYEAKDKTLRQRVDFDISKQQIVKNALAGRYREGADYYRMEQLKGLKPEDFPSKKKNRIVPDEKELYAFCWMVKRGQSLVKLLGGEETDQEIELDPAMEKELRICCAGLERIINR